MTPLLELQNISRHFGPVHAVNEVSLTVQEGVILALCGDNGAGKSVLLKTIAGVHAPTSGRILVDGHPVDFHTPRDAMNLGIATIYQDLALAQRLSIYQNVFLGSEITKPFLLPFIRVLDKRAMRQKAEKYLRQLQISLPEMDIWINKLSGGQRQAVAIARALRWNARLVIMDEPTASLGVKEAARVLDLINALHEAGATIIMVSHNMDHVVKVATHVVILCNGCKVFDRGKGDLKASQLAQLIISGGLDNNA
jgi:ABC-type sugar transport system ATPase subunit